MRLSDLNANFVMSGGQGIAKNGNPVPERWGVGLAFDCPCGCGQRVYLHFTNPLDGGLSVASKHPAWQRTGETLETITLKPSILRKGGCDWHGWLTDGKLTKC